jgi:hypothetical protein
MSHFFHFTLQYIVLIITALMFGKAIVTTACALVWARRMGEKLDFRVSKLTIIQMVASLISWTASYFVYRWIGWDLVAKAILYVWPVFFAFVLLTYTNVSIITKYHLHRFTQGKMPMSVTVVLFALKLFGAFKMEPSVEVNK